MKEILENDYVTIIEYLNKKAGTSFRTSTEKNRQLIKARMREGFTTDDFKVVIDNKCQKWKGTEYEKYLRPLTLFGTKFESYLNERADIRTYPQTENTEAEAEAHKGSFDTDDFFLDAVRRVYGAEWQP